MDLVKVIAAASFSITMLGFAVMLGRILQKLEDLGKKVDASLDPEKGPIRELRERTHDANNRDQALVNKHALHEQAFDAFRREVEREFRAVRGEIHIDDRLGEILGALRARTPPMGTTPGSTKPNE